MHKSATNSLIGKWCKNKHGASKIIDTLQTYHIAAGEKLPCRGRHEAEHHLDDELPSTTEPGRTEDGRRQRVKHQLQRKKL
jgi:hypothetical protein